MTGEQLKQAARELAANCETLGTDPDDPDIVDDFLERLGFCVDPDRATTEEARQLEEFCEEFRKAWERREAGGRVSKVARNSFGSICFVIDMTLECWHDEHSFLDEFWQDFTAYASFEELDEFIRRKDAEIVSKIRKSVKVLWGDAPSEHRAREDRQAFLRIKKKRLRDWREGCRAIRAKARVVKNDSGRVRVTVENGLVVDVSRMC